MLVGSPQRRSRCRPSRKPNALRSSDAIAGRRDGSLRATISSWSALIHKIPAPTTSRRPTTATARKPKKISRGFLRPKPIPSTAARARSRLFGRMPQIPSIRVEFSSPVGRCPIALRRGDGEAPVGGANVSEIRRIACLRPVLAVYSPGLRWNSRPARRVCSHRRFGAGDR